MTPNELPHVVKTVSIDGRSDDYIAGWNDALEAAEVAQETLSTLTAQGGEAVAWLPDEGAYLIQYDDASRANELFAGCGAKAAAMRRYAQISENWNAHLFVKIGSNSRDCTTPSATPPAPSSSAVDINEAVNR